LSAGRLRQRRAPPACRRLTAANPHVDRPWHDPVPAGFLDDAELAIAEGKGNHRALSAGGMEPLETLQRSERGPGKATGSEVELDDFVAFHDTRIGDVDGNGDSVVGGNARPIDLRVAVCERRVAQAESERV